jgi:hypothetical protein
VPPVRPLSRVSNQVSRHSSGYLSGYFSGHRATYQGIPQTISPAAYGWKASHINVLVAV